MFNPLAFWQKAFQTRNGVQLAANEAADVVDVAIGVVTVNVVATEAPDILAAAADLRDYATLSAVEAPDVISLGISIGDALTLGATEAPDAMQASGLVYFEAVFAVSEACDTVSIAAFHADFWINHEIGLLRVPSEANALYVPAEPQRLMRAA